MASGATTTRATLLPGLPLPPELLFHVFEYCEEYDWSDNAKAKYTAKQRYTVARNGALSWLRLAQSSKDDICNIRLVCKHFRETSVASFVRVLSDRTFRLTKVGLRDLQNIAAVKALAPRFQTLTFGSADVAFPYPHFKAILGHLENDGEMHREVSSIYQAWENYRRLPETEVIPGLKVALQTFSQLESLQMMVHDQPDFLAGWLTPRQRMFISTHFKEDTAFSKRYSLSYYPKGFYSSSTLHASHDVLKAFSDIGGHVKDLKFSSFIDGNFEDFHGEFRHLVPETLCSLSMHFEWREFKVFNGGGFDDYSEPFFSALGNMHNLQDLALYLSDDDYDYEYETRWTEVLFKSLEMTSKLRRIDLKGRWTFSPTLLVQFVESHVPALRHLILEGCYLDGDFFSTLHSLAAVTQGSLEYFRMWHIHENFKELALNTFYRSQWPEFTCVTDFGPDFRLLPDEEEEEEEKGNAMIEEGKAGSEEH